MFLNKRHLSRRLWQGRNAQQKDQLGFRSIQGQLSGDFIAELMAGCSALNFAVRTLAQHMVSPPKPAMARISRHNPTVMRAMSFSGEPVCKGRLRWISAEIEDFACSAPLSRKFEPFVRERWFSSKKQLVRTSH
jgi:hypothetical protein